MIAIDTNLLIYAHRQESPEHKAARKAIQKASDTDTFGIAVPSVAEFLSVVTHPSAAGRKPTFLEKATDFLSQLEDAGMQIWTSGPGFAPRLSQLALDLSVMGPRIFDLQIGLIAFENGAHEVWTHDRKFSAPPGLRVIDPL